MKTSIRKGDIVRIKPQWQDRGDSQYTWIALGDEEKGRVMIAPVNTGLRIAPYYSVTLEMLEER